MMTQQLKLTVERPNGQIEVVIHPTLDFISRSQFEQMRGNTKAAGRGHLISYQILKNGLPVQLATSKDLNNGNFERGLKQAFINTDSVKVEQMSAMGDC